MSSLLQLSSPLSKELIASLDLVSIMKRVASRTATQRGRQALLDLVQEAAPAESRRRGNDWTGQPSSSSSSSRQRRAARTLGDADSASFGNDEHDGFANSKKKRLKLPMAQNAEEARRLYEEAAQATILLLGGGGGTTMLPPIYGNNQAAADGTPMKQSSSPLPVFDLEGRFDESLDDYDDWLELPLQEWTLEHIVQAEQVIQMLLRVHEWAASEPVMTMAPLLSREIISVSGYDDDDDDDDDTAAAENGVRDVDILKPLLDEIAGAVEIVRVKTLTDPTGRSSFLFRLSGQKYKVLQLLREKQQPQIAEGGRTTTAAVPNKKQKKNNAQQQDQQDLEDELEEREQAIQRGLSIAIFKCRKVIDDALLRVARLDVIFAKAAFGLLYPAAIFPDIQQSSSSSVIYVPQFLHPLLPRNEAVPIQLRLGLYRSQEEAIGPRALILSGSNGGGKTLTMKSFGVVSILVKLGIPIPTIGEDNKHGYPSVSASTASETTGMPRRPRVDFFSNVIAVVGDRQNVMKGQSTFMAQLATYSGIIKEVAADRAASQTTLVLLDELGSGTEANAGGAIAQAILEKLLECPSCHVVATTHSLRLKTLSFENENYDCAAATILQERQQSSSLSVQDDFAATTARTTTRFHLQYGVIGESYALDAASRCTTPPLPEEVLSRAAALMASSATSSLDTTPSTDDLDYVRALTASLERQLEMVQESREMAESIAQDTAKCQSGHVGTCFGV
jgi:MutS domain V